MGLRTLDDLSPGGRLLVRLDLNSPVDDGVVRDNPRFARHAETLRELLAADHAVAVLAHQGRPGRDTFVGLEPHAELLADHLESPVEYVPDTDGDEALDAIRALSSGEVLVLGNVRMTDDELPERPAAEHAESDLVRTLAPEFDAYVNDAYSAAHRSHASLVGFPLVMPAYAGRVMEREYEANTAIGSREFDGDVVMVLGGNKTRDVVRVMQALADRVDAFLLGGAIGEHFLRAEGYEVGYDVEGTDLYDDQWAAVGGTVAGLLDEHRETIHLPADLAYADDDGERAEIEVDEIDAKTRDFLDVGTETVMAYAPVIADASAVFVKGALGVFEDDRFAVGTVGVLEAIAESDAFSVVGGGDTSRAIDAYGLDGADFSHVSIAGGAYLRALTGEPLPAVEALRASAERFGVGVEAGSPGASSADTDAA
ncbi:MAG: phosphoglycerate kinase [Haloferacaceae archaeon]